jgi:hypothetical protein
LVLQVHEILLPLEEAVTYVSWCAIWPETQHVKYQGKRRDGWFTFEFHLPGDLGRSVQLAVLVFHFPSVN